MPSKSPVDPLDGATQRGQGGLVHSLEPPPPPAAGLDADWFAAVFEVRRVIETVSQAYYLAKDRGETLPDIHDGVVRNYAYVMGQTVTWREGAPTPEHRRVHEGAISSFHSCIGDWQMTKKLLGLPVEAMMDDVQQTVAALSPQAHRAFVRQRYHQASPEPM